MANLYTASIEYPAGTEANEHRRNNPPSFFITDSLPTAVIFTDSGGIEHRYIEAQPDPRGDQLVIDARATGTAANPFIA